MIDLTLGPLQRWNGSGFAGPEGPITVRAGSHAVDPASVTAVLKG